MKPSTKKPLTLGLVARRADVGVETVRFYERQGLIEERIPLGRVMGVIDGPCDEDNRSPGASPDSLIVGVLSRVWKEAAAAQQKVLGGITLADLLERTKQQDGQMYHI